MRKRFSHCLWICGVCGAAAAAHAGEAADTPPTLQQQQLAELLADVIHGALPRQVQRDDGWGRKKNVTSGVRVSGKPYWPQFSRRKKERRHGVWRRRRVRLVDPEEQLHVRVDSLRAVEPNKFACTLVVDAKLDGWAQTRVFNRGLHVVTVTAEGESRVRLAVECEVTLRVKLATAEIAADPVVTATTLDVEEFRLKRLGELHGDPAKELGKALGKLAEELLDGPRLTARLNKAIDKKRDRLSVRLLPSWAAE